MATPLVTNEITVALQQFQAALSPEQKVKFSTSQSSSPSDVNGVLAFTAEVDALEQRRQERCVGSRLQGTLQSVQQFTSVISTFVSSNPSVAALVWGSIRFTILIASNWSTFFEKLTTFFMQMQTCCPRFLEYQLLYPESKKLQEVLCSFYACLVRFCTKALATVNETGPFHIARSIIVPFESQFGSHLVELKSKGKSVKDEIALASHKAAALDRELQIVERKDASKSRSSSKIFQARVVRHNEQEQAWRKQIEQRHERARKQTLLNKLSTFDHIAPLKRERKKRFGDTGTWLVRTTEYRNWAVSSSSSVFLLSGILGANADSAFYLAGKTVLTASVIDDINISGQTQIRKLAFFFCQHDNAVSLDLFTILRSITRQLLTEDDIPASIEPVLDKVLNEHPSEEDVFELFVQINRSLGLPVFLVIDGFDELAPTWCHILLSFFSRLLEIPDLDVKLFISSRESTTSEIKTSFKKNFHHHSMRCRENDDDIKRYIELSVDQRIEGRELSVGDKELLPTIKKGLCEGASSMFLWVFFQIEELCAQLTDEDIIQTLKTLPKDLPSTYERLFNRIITDKKQDIVKRMLEWALVSKRPLTVMELRDAIAIRRDQSQYERRYLVNEADRMISWCCNLLIVDEEDSVVHFPHYSVKEFLLGTSHSRKPSTKMFRFDEVEADIKVCHLCCTYLQFSDFERQMVRIPPRTPDVTPRDILDTALTSNNRSLTAKAWTNLSKIQPNKRQKGGELAFTELTNLAAKNFAVGLTSLYMQFPLFAYANEYWSWHGSRLTAKVPSGWQSFEKLFDSTNVYITRPLADINWRNPSTLELETIAQRDHSVLMQISLTRMRVSSVELSAPLHHLLTLSIEHTSFQVLQTVSITGEPCALSYVQSDFEPMEAFELALKGGKAETAAWVLKWIDVIDEETFDSFLQYLRPSPHRPFHSRVKRVRLPQKSLRRNADYKMYLSMCLDIAERIGPGEIFSLLQLCIIASEGLTGVVIRLRRPASAENDATVARHLKSMESIGDAQSYQIVINTALAFAVRDAQSRLAQDMLSAGADANLVLSSTFTILHLAIYADSRDCHSLLLEHGADPNCAKLGIVSTELRYISDGLVHDISSATKRRICGDSALAYAIKRNCREIARDLLEAGAIDTMDHLELLEIICDALGNGDRQLVYALAFRYEWSCEVIATSKRSAVAVAIRAIAEEHYSQHSQYPKLYNKGGLGRSDFEALFVSRYPRQCREIAGDLLLKAGAIDTTGYLELSEIICDALDCGKHHIVYMLAFRDEVVRGVIATNIRSAVAVAIVAIAEAHYSQHSEYPELYLKGELSRKDFGALRADMGHKIADQTPNINMSNVPRALETIKEVGASMK